MKRPIDPSLVSARNPTGIKLSKAQIDESTRRSYWIHAIEYGVQYYVSGRFAVAARFTPVCASLLHHAVELLLKACLAYDDSLEMIQAYGRKTSYGHSLSSLWPEFKRRNPRLDVSEFDEIVIGLDAFESIRYPDTLVTQGAILHVGMHEVERPTTPPGDTPMPEPVYVLMLPQIDRLVGRLLQQTGVNPAALQSLFWSEPAVTYLRMLNSTDFPGLTP